MRFSEQEAGCCLCCCKNLHLENIYLLKEKSFKSQNVHVCKFDTSAKYFLLFSPLVQRNAVYCRDGNYRLSACLGQVKIEPDRQKFKTLFRRKGWHFGNYCLSACLAQAKIASDRYIITFSGHTSEGRAEIFCHFQACTDLHKFIKSLFPKILVVLSLSVPEVCDVI